MGLASVILAVFGLLSAANLGLSFGPSRTGMLSDDKAAACVGGAVTCTPAGGPNCGDSSHACASTGCTASTTTCSSFGNLCVMLKTLSVQSTFPCATYSSGGSCRAYSQSNCIVEMSGPDSNWWFACDYGSYYCNGSTTCGEPLYLQKSS